MFWTVQKKEVIEFHTFIQNKRSVITSLWRKLAKQDVVIVELKYEEDFNPIFIDINDFQFFMPPFMMLDPYTEQDIDKICTDICNGQIRKSTFPSGIIQAHLPYIRSENIGNV